LRVLLINPRFQLPIDTRTTPHLGLAYLAAVSERRGDEVRIFDMDVEEARLTDFVREYQPDIVGITSNTPQVKQGWYAAREIKSVIDVLIVQGGPHVSALPEESASRQEIDVVARGEGEDTWINLCEVVERAKAGNPKFQARDLLDPSNKFLDSVLGITYQLPDGRIKHNHERTAIADLDALPFPAYHFFKMERYTSLQPAMDAVERGKSFSMMTSRGCPYRCTYCGNTRFLEIDKVFGKLRHSSVEHLIAEIRAAIDKVPHISSIAFHDDCFIGLPPETLQEFSDKMKSEIGLPFAIHGVTPADIRKEKIEILLGGGLNRVRMGVQSGSDKILRFYKRPNRAGFVKQAIDTLGLFAHRMMPPTYDMIFDNPIETKEDIEATLRLIYDMPRPFVLNIYSLRYIPNTELGRQLASLDIAVEGIDKAYTTVKPTFANALMYTVYLVKLPRPLFEYLLRFAKPYRESTFIPRHVITFLRTLIMIKRAYFHIKWRDFSVALGRLGWMLKRHGLLKVHPQTSAGTPKLAPQMADQGQFQGHEHVAAE
jgi:anaerobic magnesium-protoporphyrin IX monomethyl ester cyclase